MSDSKQTQSTPAYGSREWLDQQYSRTGSDPWGLDWRPSQAARYHHMLDARTSLTEQRAQPFQRLLLDMRWNNPKHRKLLELEGARQWVVGRDSGYTHLEAALEDQRAW